MSLISGEKFASCRGDPTWKTDIDERGFRGERLHRADGLPLMRLICAFPRVLRERIKSNALDCSVAFSRRLARSRVREILRALTF